MTTNTVWCHNMPYGGPYVTRYQMTWYTHGGIEVYNMGLECSILCTVLIRIRPLHFNPLLVVALGDEPSPKAANTCIIICVCMYM